VTTQIAMAEIRDAEIRIDMMIMPVEEAYIMLNKYQMNFNDGNAERVDTISYGWKLLKQQVPLKLFIDAVLFKH
jgi:dynein heavy chain, axonemal